MNCRIIDLNFIEFGLEFIQQNLKVWGFWLKWRIQFNKVHFFIYYLGKNGWVLCKFGWRVMVKFTGMTKKKKKVYEW